MNDQNILRMILSLQNDPDIQELLNELEIDHDGSLVIRRKIYRSGKNSVFIIDNRTPGHPRRGLGWQYRVDLCYKFPCRG